MEATMETVKMIIYVILKRILRVENANSFNSSLMKMPINTSNISILWPVDTYLILSHQVN